MSVNFWTAEELGEVAACASRKMLRASGSDPLSRLTALLADYSRANAGAYNASYKENVPAVSAGEIMQAAAPVAARLEADGPQATRTCDRANGVAGLLAYNAVANDGRDFLGEALGRKLKPVITATRSAHAEFVRMDEAREESQRVGHIKAAAGFKGSAVGGKAYKAPPPNVVDRGNGPFEDYDRRTTVNRVKKALNARTGRPWVVSTSKSYLDGVNIDAPEARKTCFRDGRAVVSKRELGEWWDRHGYGTMTEKQAEDLFTSMCNDDRRTLADALGFDKDSHSRRQIMERGEYHCFASGCSADTVARAEGRPSTTRMRSYEYD